MVSQNRNLQSIQTKKTHKSKPKMKCTIAVILAALCAVSMAGHVGFGRDAGVTVSFDNQRAAPYGGYLGYGGYGGYGLGYGGYGLGYGYGGYGLGYGGYGLGHGGYGLGYGGYGLGYGGYGLGYGYGLGHGKFF